MNTEKIEAVHRGDGPLNAHALRPNVARVWSGVWNAVSLGLGKGALHPALGSGRDRQRVQGLPVPQWYRVRKVKTRGQNLNL
jgi:hypothetical protein